MTSDAQRRDWDDMAAVDPMWAVLSHPDKKQGRWDATEFLASGDEHVERVLRAAEPWGVPAGHDCVLDFGCGLGRLAGALSSRFTNYVGVDVSSTMVQQARDLHADRGNCTFVVAGDPTLPDIHDQSIDMVVSFFVLQHVDDRTRVEQALTAMARVLAPGGLLVVQLPSAVHPVARVAHGLRRAAYRALRGAGIRPDAVYRRLGLAPMSMRGMPEGDVVRRLGTAGLRMLAVERGTMGWTTANRVYFATRGDGEAEGDRDRKTSHTHSATNASDSANARR